nr:MAG TPA: hypothetical protein [Caudoviricetes sp.]
MRNKEITPRHYAAGLFPTRARRRENIFFVLPKSYAVDLGCHGIRNSPLIYILF